jgi:Outer membrane protein beta-barrel family
LELAVSTRFKQTFVNISVFGNQTDNGIMQIRSIYDSTGAIITKFENIGKQKNLGLNFFGNIYLTPKWTVNGGLDVAYNILEGLVTNEKGLSVQASNSGFSGGGRLMSTLTLKDGWAIQGFGGMHGARVQLQGTSGGFSMYSVGFRKDFKNKKGSIGLAGENFLRKSVVVRSELKSDYLSQNSVMNLYNSGVRINLAYKFGKMGFEQKKKTRSVKNDDLKDGGGGDGGGDAGGGAAQPQGGGGRPQGAGAPQQGGQSRPQGTGAPQQGGQSRPQGTGAQPQGGMQNGAKMPEKPAKTGEKPQEKKEEDKSTPQKPAPIKQD